MKVVFRSEVTRNGVAGDGVSKTELQRIAGLTSAVDALYCHFLKIKDNRDVKVVIQLWKDCEEFKAKFGIKRPSQHFFVDGNTLHACGERSAQGWAHELVHVIDFAYFKKHPLAVISEGLAEEIAIRIAGKGVAQYPMNLDRLSIKAVEQRILALLPHGSYTFARLFVNYLLEEHGTEKLLQLHSQTNRAWNIKQKDEAYRRIFGRNMDCIDKMFKNWILDSGQVDIPEYYPSLT